MRRENLPANELMGRRMESGVLAVLGQLEATRNWYRIGREWWFADPPATELGERGVGLLRVARREAGAQVRGARHLGGRAPLFSSGCPARHLSRETHRCARRRELGSP